MSGFFKDYLSTISVLHTEIESQIEGLSVQELDIRIGDQSSSLSVLVVHICGAERYWVGEVACGIPSGRKRDEEFRVAGLDASTLSDRLKENLAFIERALANLDFADLSTTTISPRDNRRVTIAWALLHVLEHDALHLGHIQITSQLIRSGNYSSI